jgi:hypothetical protein
MGRIRLSSHAEFGFAAKNVQLWNFPTQAKSSLEWITRGLPPREHFPKPKPAFPFPSAPFFGIIVRAPQPAQFSKTT